LLGEVAMIGRSACQIAQDAVDIRGILDLLGREIEPASSTLVQMTQHMGPDQASRLLKLMQKAGVVEHPLATRDVLGVKQKVPCLQLWQLTEAARRGEIPEAEEIVGRGTA
jgi:hypothetical protein